MNIPPLGKERSDVLVLFGVTGDLVRKKILPALYAMEKRRVLEILPQIFGMHGQGRQITGPGIPRHLVTLRKNFPDEHTRPYQGMLCALARRQSSVATLNWKNLTKQFSVNSPPTSRLQSNPRQKPPVLFVNTERILVPHTHPANASNRLLASLPDKDRRRFLERCEIIELGFAELLSEPGEPIGHVYFPTDSFISLVSTIDDGRPSIEVGLVGDEGMLGITLILGVDISPLRAVVQGKGQALRMAAEPFCRELEHSPALKQQLKRYLYVLMRQFAQAAACMRFHVVEARLARWLLMSRDRAHSDEFHVTHEFLAYMLGVRRVGVTRAATALQQRRLISYRRGDMAILDRGGLEAAACGCYEADKATYTRTME